MMRSLSLLTLTACLKSPVVVEPPEFVRTGDVQQVQCATYEYVHKYLGEREFTGCWIIPQVDLWAIARGEIENPGLPIEFDGESLVFDGVGVPEAGSYRAERGGRRFKVSTRFYSHIVVEEEEAHWAGYETGPDLLLGELAAANWGLSPDAVVSRKHDQSMVERDRMISSWDLMGDFTGESLE